MHGNSDPTIVIAPQLSSHANNIGNVTTSGSHSSGGGSSKTSIDTKQGKFPFYFSKTAHIDNTENEDPSKFNTKSRNDDGERTIVVSHRPTRDNSQNRMQRSANSVEKLKDGIADLLFNSQPNLLLPKLQKGKL